MPDNDERKQDMAQFLELWHSAAVELSKKVGCNVLPIVKYFETGAHSAPLPKTGFAAGEVIPDLCAHIAKADIVIAMTTFSATGPLFRITAETGNRAVSIPGAQADMWPAMSIDYLMLKKRSDALKSLLEEATGIEVSFSGKHVPEGTNLFVDVRGSKWHTDGKCGNPGESTNLPAGEVYCVPRESSSETRGTWPVYSPEDGNVVLLKVEGNKIIDVPGDSRKAVGMRRAIEKDPNCANVAEMSFGLNDAARSGEDVSVIEKEKAGPHIAWGMSIHLGGTVTAGQHNDEVYTNDTPVTVTVHAVYERDGSAARKLIAENGKVVAV